MKLKPGKDQDLFSISRQLKLLFWIFFVGFGLQALVSYSSSQYNERLDKQLQNARVQGILGSEIIDNINELERYYYQITTQMNPKARDLTLKDVQKRVEEVEFLVEVLNQGGSFTQTLKLNLPDKDNVIREWHYSPVEVLPFDVLRIDVLPKLNNLQQKFLELNDLMDRGHRLIESNDQHLSQHLSEVQGKIKNTIPLFIRLLENTNRVYYQQQNYLRQLQADIDQKKSYFELGKYATTAFLLILVLIGFRLISRHIQQMAEDLRVQKDTALAATKSKSVFLANMSHEIRTPLNAITGFIALLKQHEEDQLKLKYLNTIEDSSSSLIGIINDILDFSKIESNKLEIDLIDFNPHTEFNSTADLFRARCSEKNITFHINIAREIPESLHSDPLRIKQVITNLLSNAVKFTEPDKSVFLDIQYDQSVSELKISVEDQGIGISEVQQQKIFQPFSQAESHTTRKFGGTGLGLTISRLLIELLGGELKVESELNKGSRFYFSLPVKQGAPIEKSKNEPLDLSLSGHLLLVEDNHTNQLLMGAILKKLKLEFDLAKDGLEAVEAYQNKDYDLILMDENMPNMSGSEATGKIRELERTSGRYTPIVALTANAMKGDREKFLAAGMDEYLNKPIVLKDLQMVLGKFLSE